MTQLDPTPRPDGDAADGRAAGLVPDALSAETDASSPGQPQAAPIPVDGHDDALGAAAAVVEMQPDAELPHAAVVQGGAAAEVLADEEVVDPAVAEALTASADGAKPSLKVGQKLKARLVQIGETDCFLDFGGRSEGILPVAEIRDAQGAPRHKVGDEIDVVVKQLGDQVVLTLGRKGPPPILGKLQQAFESGALVQGLIRKTNKGGFDVSLRGARAFCPMSQMELGHCAKPEEYVGQKLPFLIITFERGGRNIVVSRRKLLEAEAKEASAKTRERLAVGEVFQGTVRRIQPYGAFVDLGGLDGLLHVSEISRARINDPGDVLQVGQAVQVKVIRIEGEGTDKERISLSMKEFEPDPWADIAQRLKENDVAKGKVVRLTEFGAFVQLEAGVDGLIHISEISHQRIGHPRDVLAVGQPVEARVLRVDAEKQRVSLSLRAAGEGEGDGEGFEPPAMRIPRPPRREREMRPRHDGRQPEEAPRRRNPVQESPAGEPDGAVPMDYDEKLEALKRKFNVRA